MDGVPIGTDRRASDDDEIACGLICLMQRGVEVMPITSGIVGKGNDDGVFAGCFSFESDPDDSLTRLCHRADDREGCIRQDEFGFGSIMPRELARRANVGYGREEYGWCEGADDLLDLVG